MRELSELGPTYSDAFDDIRGQVENLRRDLSAMLMVEYPDRDFLVNQARLLQTEMGVDAIQVNVILNDKQITIVSQPDGSITSVSIDVLDSLCSLSVGNNETLSISDIKKSDFLDGCAVKRYWGSWAASPIKVAGQSAGSVCALGNDPRLWTKADEQHLNRVADLISKAVDEWAGNLSNKELK